MHPPKILKPYVLSFCRKISKEEPFFVPLRPLPGTNENDCLNIIEEHAQKFGGRRVLGWGIWEWRNVMIEGEFHAVWEAPSGEVVDLTPRQTGSTEILFLPDPRIRYKGRQIDNIRKPLSKSKDIDRFLWLAAQITLELNKGELADYHGPISPQGRLLELLQEKAFLQRKLTVKYGQS